MFWILIDIINRKFNSYEKKLIKNLLKEGADIHEGSWDSDDRIYTLDIKQSVLQAYKNYEEIYSSFAGDKDIEVIIKISVHFLEEYWNEAMDIVEGKIEF